MNFRMSETNTTTGQHLSDTCTVTISGHGKPVTAELPTKEATALGELAELLSGAPRRPGELSAEEIALRKQRYEEARQGGRSLLSELGTLTEDQITLVGQYVRLLRFGDKGLSSNENWILEIIDDLLHECIYDGIGGALASGPGKALRGLAYSYWGFRQSIDQVREATKEYKELFKDPAADAEMAATVAVLDKALESTRALGKVIHRTARKIAKERSARKSRSRRAGVR
jgi:hypothetical protein